MKIEQSEHNPDTVRILADAHELVCDGGKPLPYPTWIGTISRSTGKITVWTPAGYVPRGYRAAALRALEAMAVKLKEGA